MIEPIKPTAEQIHHTETLWASASEHLDKMLDHLSHDVPMLKKMTGLSDASILFDYIATTIIATHPDVPRLNTVEIVGAAALTRLAQASRGEIHDMTQFEKELDDGQ